MLTVLHGKRCIQMGLWFFFVLVCLGPQRCTAGPTSPTAENMTSFRVCKYHSHQLNLRDSQELFFHLPNNTSSSVVLLHSERCGSFDTAFEIMDFLNETAPYGTDEDGVPWYKLKLRYSYDSLALVFYTEHTAVNVTDEAWQEMEWKSYTCLVTGVGKIKLTFNPDVELRVLCPDLEEFLPPDDQGNAFGRDPFFPDSDVGTHVDYGTYTSYGSTGMHFVYIPVGAIFVLCIACSRCLYGRARQQQVLVPVARRQVRIVSSFPPNPQGRESCSTEVEEEEDHPPSYADIEGQVPPPYSEVDLKRDDAALSLGEVGAWPTATTTDEGAPKDTSSSSLARHLNRNNQFSFKPLEEEEY